MPLAALLPAAIGAATTIGSAVAGGLQARKNRKFQEQQNALDRKWQLEAWNRENAYNHPKQQIQRLREAGLNPHLIYGNGAENTARSMATPNQTAPQSNFDISKYIGAGSEIFESALAARTQSAQLSLMEEQKKLLMQEQLYKAAQTLDTQGQTMYRNTQHRLALDNYQDLVKRVKLENIKLDADITKTQADTQFTLDANERAELMTSQNIKESIQRILESKARTAKTQAEKDQINKMIYNLSVRNEADFIKLKQLRNLAPAGLAPDDPYYVRIYGILWDNIMNSLMQ